MNFRAIIPELLNATDAHTGTHTGSNSLPEQVSRESTSAGRNPLAQARATYEEEQILNASPQQLLLMLFDGAIKSVLLSKKAFETRTLEVSAKELVRAQRILRELMDTLDFEIAPDIAKNLYSIYEYLHYQLVQANVTHDSTLLDEVLWHLRTLRKTWAEASQKAAVEGDTNTSADPLPSSGQTHVREKTRGEGFQQTLEQAQSRASYDA